VQEKGKYERSVDEETRIFGLEKGYRRGEELNGEEVSDKALEERPATRY